MLNNLEQSKRNNIIITINSTVIYVFTSLLVYLIYQLITATVASEYNITTIFYIDQLKFLTPDNNYVLWNRDSALTVFGAAPLICLVLAFVSMMMYSKYSENKSILKLFFLWGTLHLINRILGTFIIGTIFFLYGSNLIVDWMYFGMEVKIVLTAVSLILLIIIGSYSVIPILASANSNTLLKGENRQSFIIHQVYLPWLIGTIILFIFHLPKTPLNENLINFTMLIMMVPLYFKFKSHMFPEADKDEVSIYKYSWRFILFLIIIMILIKIVFNSGIPFGGKEGSDMDYIWVFLLIIAIIIGLIIQFFKVSSDKRNEIRKIMGDNDRTF